MGITGPKLRTEKTISARYFFGANGDGAAEDRVLAGVVDVLRQQHDHQLAVALENQALVGNIKFHFHAGQAVAEAGHNLFNQRRYVHRGGMNGDLAGIQARGGQQASGQIRRAGRSVRQ